MSAAAEIDSFAAARVGALLAQTSFAERVEVARRAGFATYQPWPLGDDDVPDAGSGGQTALGGGGLSAAGEDAALRPAGKDGVGAALFGLLHRGGAERECFDTQLWSDLCALGLVEEDGAHGKWELTAYRSLIAARDRPRGGKRGQVHIGEDSLRFAEFIMGVAPTGVALDVGSGSGMSTCALGRTCTQVHAIDVVEECLDATSLSMGLNGMGAKALVSYAQLDAFEPPIAFDCAVGNLPGVPVPPGLTYPPDGAGGPDGLALMRLFLERCQASLVGAGGVVIMRFQSLGNERGPLLLDELRELAPGARWDISVMTESRIPAEVRAALTAHHALPVNPGADPHEMLARTDEHLLDTGYGEYYASTLVARPGSGVVTYNNLSSPSLMHRQFRLAGEHKLGKGIEAAIVPAYYGRAHDLPDSFWELGSLAYISEPVVRLPSILDRLRMPTTLADLVEWVFADEVAREPIRARFLLVTMELMLGCLIEQGLAEPA
jgi:hypothetical protein